MREYIVILGWLCLCSCSNPLFVAEDNSYVTQMGQDKVMPTDKNIIIEGAMQLKSEGGRVIINRHSDKLWDNEGVLIEKPRARTQTGVRILFKTDSKTIKPLFVERKGDGMWFPKQNVYGVYKDGVFIGAMSGVNLELKSTQMTEWEIVLPIMYSVDFGGLLIDEGAQLYPLLRAKREVYVAIGNSITHGVGQQDCGSEGSYPFILARAKRYYLYNLGVGASQISPAIATELSGIKADIITVMWGFNDWNATRGDVEVIADRYDKLLLELRKTQPTAKIYCILPSKARNEEGNVTKPPLSNVREAERAIIKAAQQKGDNKLFIIEGDKISEISYLYDDVHFNNNGARRFAESLADLIE